MLGLVSLVTVLSLGPESAENVPKYPLFGRVLHWCCRMLLLNGRLLIAASLASFIGALIVHQELDCRIELICRRRLLEKAVN